MRPDAPRPTTTGPSTGPESPFPLLLEGPVVAGFGRGSKELGIPTANIPIDVDESLPSEIESGIYYGYASLNLTGEECGLSQEQMQTQKEIWGSSREEGSSGVLLDMVMSVGWNPFYKNTVRSAEIHIIHKFPKDFYGAYMKVLVLGYIRPEYDYVSKESLIDDIHTDIKVAVNSLERPAYKVFEKDERMKTFPVAEGKTLS